MRMKKLLTFLTLLTLFFGVGWAETKTATINFGSASGSTNINSASVTGSDSQGNTWTITTTGTTSFTPNSAYAQVGSNKNPATKITFTTTLSSSVTFTSVSAKFGGFSGTTGSVYLKVGNTSIGGGNLDATNDVVINSTSTETGTTLTIEVSSIEKGVKCYYITYTYETSGGTTEPDPTTPSGTISFNPAAGEVASGTTVSLSFSGTCDGIKYTTDGTTDPDATHGTVYDSSNPPAITEATTIKAAAYNYSNSTYAFGNVATAAYTVSSSGGGTTSTATLTNANIVAAGTANTGYKSWTLTDENSKTWTAYAIKNQHSNATSSYHFLQIKKYASSTAYYLQVPEYGTKITQIKMTVSNTSQPMTGGGNTATLFFSSSNSTSSTGTGVASGTGSGSVTIDCSSLNLNTGYITADAAVRIWNVTVYYEEEEEGDYTINRVCDPTAGGSISCGSSSDAGETVSFTVSANDNYEFEYVEVKDANNAAVEFTEDTNNPGTYSFTMPESDVTITAHFGQAGTLYILGEANGKFDNADWQPNEGTLMTYSNGKYIARAYFKGYTKYNDGDGYSEFAFTKRLATNDKDNGGWNEINSDGSRYGSGAEGSYWGIGGENQSAFGSTIPLYNHSQKSYRVPAGVYDIEVDLKTYPHTVKVTPVDLSVTLDPASGTFNKGKEIAISSNLTTIVAATGSGETVAISHKIGDGSFENGATATLNDAGENITVTGKAALGHIEVEGTGTYTIENKYTVTVASGITNGQISVSETNVAPGTEVTITATPNSGYSLASLTVTDANNNPITVTDGKFTMPESNVTVSATFAVSSYSIIVNNTNCSVAVASTANYNSQVTFTVTPRSDKYEVTSYSVTYGNGNTKPVTDNGDGTYSFYMPAADVTITVVCERKSIGGNQFTLVKAQSDIVAGGEYVILEEGGNYAMSYKSSNYDTPSNQFSLTDDVVTLSDGSNVSIFKLANGTTNGTFTMQDGTLGYVTTPTSSGGKPSVSTTGGDWTISYSNGVFTVKGGNLFLRYNSDHFRVYTSSTQGDGLKLYKRLPGVASVEIDPGTSNVIGSQVVSVGSDTDGALVQYKVEKQNGSNWDVVTDWTDWATYTEANGPVEFTITGNVGDVYQVTARAKEADQELEPGEEEDYDEKTVQYTFVTPDAPSITPASQSIIDVKQNVTIESGYTNGTIEYSTDGGTTWTTYEGAFDVYLQDLGSSVTVQARVTVNGVTSEVAEATYTRNVQPVVFSPVSGTYYYGTQSVEMFSITQGARIYYTMTDDGSEPAEPVMNGTGVSLYNGPIEGLEAGKTYKFKAYAYIGTIHSELSTAEYTIEAHDTDFWQNVAAMNADDGSVTKYFENPVQVVYMSTYQNNGNTPEFCYVRDNSGYGLVYFAKNHTAYNNYTKFHMGDWLEGKSVQGTTDVWYDGFHNELGNSSGAISNWPSTRAGNTAILPEEVTNADIKAGWDATAYANGTKYADGVTESNLWGHYVHLRKNQITDLTTIDSKYKGVMTDENGDVLTYYDAFYKFSGFGTNAKTYDSDFYTTRQIKGATFDFYAVVAFYGPDINKEAYANQPFQIIPIDILWVYKPVISGVNSTDVYTSAQTVELSIDKVEGDDESNSVIWYKTREMDDYAIYTGPFEVSTTTTIEAYTTKMTSYNDRMESLVTTMDVHFTTINPPVISPESTVKAIGSESVNSTITRDASDDLSDVVIFFTIDGSDPSDPNSTRYEYTAENQAQYLSDIRTTTTVRAIAAVYNQTSESYVYSAEAEARTYTFVKSNGIVYDLVTNVSQLTSNGVYVIVSRAHSEAMSNVQNTSNRGAAGVMFVPETDTPNYHGEEQSIYGNDDVAVFTLTPLTDASDTGSEKHFLFQTNNGKTSDATGYIYVGSNDDNTLLTEAEEDDMANDVAVVTIDADGRAHIRFNYAGGDNRYLQYWNRDRLFSTYKSEYNDRAVYIYYKNATPLATIEKEGVPNGQYTIADQLLAVYADVAKGMLWCKDQGNVSIAKTEKQEGQIDFMKEITKEQTTDWDQSNWVVLQFDEPTLGSELETLLTNAPGKYIKPATISGTYSDVNNYTITMADQTLQLEDDGENYVKNLYCTANFLPGNLNVNGGNGALGNYHGEDAYYFFMNPKIQEVCEITYAEWDGNNLFIVPLPTADNPTQNDSKIDGAFTVAWTYNVLGKDQVPNLSVGTAYKFYAVVQRTENSGYLKSVPDPSLTPSDQLIVYPLNLDPNDTQYDNVITAIDKVDVAGNGVVKSVKYVNVAGMVSDTPFQGVNIVVTEYTDGTRTATKMLKK